MLPGCRKVHVRPILLGVALPGLRGKRPTNASAGRLIHCKVLQQVVWRWFCTPKFSQASVRIPPAYGTVTRWHLQVGNKISGTLYSGPHRRDFKAPVPSKSKRRDAMKEPRTPIPLKEGGAMRALPTNRRPKQKTLQPGVLPVRTPLNSPRETKLKYHGIVTVITIRRIQ